MAFVNEYVPEESINKYNLAVIDKNYFKGHYDPQWTRDSTRDIYLRWMRDGGEDSSDQNTFTLFWKGTLIQVDLNYVNREGRALNTIIWGMKGMDAPWWEDSQKVRMATQNVLQENKTEIIDDMKAALIVYQGLGIHSPVTNLNITFEF